MIRSALCFEIMKMKKRDWTFIIGMVFLALWISHLPYLFEFSLHSDPGIQKLAKWTSEAPNRIKDEVGFGGKNQNDIEADLVAYSRVIFAESLLLCLLGIISGALILRRNRVGRYLAIGLSGVFLSIKLFKFLMHEYPFQSLYSKYTLFFPKYPFRVLHLDIVTNLVLIITLVYLLRPNVGKSFSGTWNLKT